MQPLSDWKRKASLRRRNLSHERKQQTERTNMKMPTKILVYVCDYDQDGNAIFAVANWLEEIPEINEGENIAEYHLVSEKELVVKRELIPITKPPRKKK